MDPFIEGDLWTSFHALFATHICAQLIPKISPRYVALPEKRYIAVAADDDEASARTTVVEVHRTGDGKAMPTPGLTASAPFVLDTIMAEPEPYLWVEIHEARKNRLVTAIEILSPSNKWGKTREEYLEKRTEYLHSNAHLIEIDLVRQGKRLPFRKPLPPAPYYVLLSRAGQRPTTEVWPIAWEQPLPEIPVPLLPGDPDVPLDLQAVFNRVYTEYRLDLNIDYAKDPQVAIPPEKSVWVAEMLRKANGKP